MVCFNKAIMPYTKPLSHLPKSKRPRERLLKTGATNLTNAELLAIILGSGSQKRNVLSLARQITKRFENFTKRPLKLTTQDLTNLHGVGPVKAAQILALIEFGQRNFSPHQVTRIMQPTDVLPELKQLRQSRREQLVGLYLNARYELQAKETLAVGSLNSQRLVIRDVFAKAIILPSRCLLLAHNHPSGDTQPSHQDLMTTQKIKEACKLLGVELLDHLIVTQTDCLSFKENELL